MAHATIQRPRFIIAGCHTRRGSLEPRNEERFQAYQTIVFLAFAAVELQYVSRLGAFPEAQRSPRT